MIKHITIKDSPTFQSLSLSFSEGFNVFSGASGAGKSVFTESILALFGLREANAALIEATLLLPPLQDQSETLFSQEELEDECVLTLTKKDKTRLFLNARNVSKRYINNILTPTLYHISPKTSNELQSDNLLRILDLLIMQKNASFKETLENYKKVFSAFKEAQSTLKELQEQNKNLESLKEFTQFEIQKISQINPKVGEYEELLHLKKMLSKKEKIAQSLQEVRNFLELENVVYQFLELCQEDSTKITEALGELSSIVDLQSDKLEEMEECNAEKILDRIEALSELKHRYGSIEEALEYLKAKQEELKNFQNLSQNLKLAEEKLQKTQKESTQLAEQITKERKKFLGAFEEVLNTHLKSLKIAKASLNLSSTALYELGGDTLSLSLQGASSTQLSSGEHNRTRLALLLCELEFMKATTHRGVIILDEVDANLSGAESEGVAQALSKLSTKFQIFAISHQPHMIPLASKHFLVSKHREHSSIKELNKEERINEIARIVSGETITQEALDFAKKKMQTHSKETS